MKASLLQFIFFRTKLWLIIIFKTNRWWQAHQYTFNPAIGF